MKFPAFFVFTILFITQSTLGQEGGINSKVIHQFGVIGDAITGGFYEVPDGYEKNMRFGWSAGAYFMQGVPNFCWMPQLLFAKRNFLSDQNLSGFGNMYNSKEEFSVTRLLLNIDFLYTPRLNSKLRLLIGGGPYFGHGLSAKKKQTWTVNSGGTIQVSKFEDNLGFGEKGAQRTEYGFQTKVGAIVHDRLIMNIGYAINARRFFTDTDEFRTNMFEFGFGYNFLKKKAN